jgi:hypothetical protein
MESKALRMSRLKRRAGIFALLNLVARFFTYKKLSWMLLFLMKALWALETSPFMNGAKRSASNFAIILAIACMRLIGRKWSHVGVMLSWKRTASL